MKLLGAVIIGGVLAMGGVNLKTHPVVLLVALVTYAVVVNVDRK